MGSLLDEATYGLTFSDMEQIASKENGVWERHYKFIKDFIYPRGKKAETAVPSRSAMRTGGRPEDMPIAPNVAVPLAVD